MVRAVASLTLAVLFVVIVVVASVALAATPRAPRRSPASKPAASAAPSASGAKLVITEIMYDPLSSESDDQQTEWVEIRNVGPSAVNLQGFQLTSGSKQKPHDAKQRFVIGNVAIAPGAYAVIGVGAEPCYKDFDLPAFAAYAGEAKYAWLTNNGDAIAIRDTRGDVIDEVIYATEDPWPIIKSSGSSIQFVQPAGEDPTTANDDPKNWVASDSTNSDAFAKHGKGTPGAGPKSAVAASQPVRSAAAKH
jgi:hypothetical protein